MNVMILDIKTADLVYQKADGHQSDVSLLPHWGTGQANPNINVGLVNWSKHESSICHSCQKQDRAY